MELQFIQKWISSANWPDPADSVILSREWGQARVRVVICLILMLYLFGMAYPIDLAQGMPFWMIYLIGYALFSILFARHIRRSDSSPGLRRLIGNIGDIGTISFLMVVTGESGIPLFVLYLWVTFGNGFRFGVPPLVVSTVLSVFGFIVVIAMTPIWQQHGSLVGGVLLALIVLPLYTGHLITLLHSALAKAKEASTAKSQFLARMSHELRTPLNGILGSAEILRDSQRLMPEERALLDVIEDSVNISLRQIGNVLDFSKIESGKLLLEETNLDLHQLLNSTASIIQPAVSKKKLRFLLRIAPNVPYRLRGDSHHLREVILNLLANAIRFTQKGCIWLDVTLKEQDQSTAKLRFEIHDTGIGIAPDALERIFESFAQEDTGTTRRYGGTGLGTTIAKKLVELMGGRIGVDSIKYKGTTFWFELSFAKMTDSDIDGMLAGDARALLVSEDVSLVNSYREILGERLIQSTSFSEAKNIVLQSIQFGNPFHAVLVDQAKVLDTEGSDNCREIFEQTFSSRALMVLVGNQPRLMSPLYEWDYNTTLSRNPTKEEVFSVLRASPCHSLTSEANPKVKTVAPWVWTDRKINRKGRRPQILVADDNRTNLMITSRILKKAGFDVDSVETGDKALDKLYAGEYRLAILDMHMPGLDGTDVLRQYRMMRPKSSLPVIVLTANVSFSAQQACAEVGANAYLAKPVTSQQLLNEVQRLLDDTQVEILQLDNSQRELNVGGSDYEDEIDISVLAELDRICNDPRELALLTKEYEREGDEILQHIAKACSAQNHPAFCDEVQALKSNATNVGARNLIQVCSKAGAVGLLEFKRDHTRLLEQLQESYVTSLAVLRKISGAAPQPDNDKLA